MWTTLHPDRPHELEETFKPEVGPPPIQMRPGMTYAEFQELQRQRTPVRTWNHVHGFKDGETYDIGIAEGVAVKEWVQGSLKEIMDAMEAGEMREASMGKIDCVLESGAEFTVMRPDTEGSMDGLV